MLSVSDGDRWGAAVKPHSLAAHLLLCSLVPTRHGPPRVCSPGVGDPCSTLLAEEVTWLQPITKRLKSTVLGMPRRGRKPGTGEEW